MAVVDLGRPANLHTKRNEWVWLIPIMPYLYDVSFVFLQGLDISGIGGVHNYHKPLASERKRSLGTPATIKRNINRSQQANDIGLKILSRFVF